MPEHSTFRIEAARLEDLPALCELLTVLFSQEAEFMPDEAAQRQGLAQIIQQPAVGLILVAREPDGAIVGMVNLLYTVSTALGARVALLEDMVVHPRCRGGGIGSALLQAAVAVAREQGCRRITLLTDGSNAPAQRFYEQHGFAVSTMVPYRLVLRPTG